MEHDVLEIKDRLRRVETRLTNYLEAQGHNTGAVKPEWVGQGRAIHLPSLKSNLRDILKVIPEGLAFRGDITIVCKGIRVGVIYIDPNYTVDR
jgi:hypothetical protein